MITDDECDEVCNVVINKGPQTRRTRRTRRTHRTRRSPRTHRSPRSDRLGDRVDPVETIYGPSYSQCWTGRDISDHH